VRRGAAAAAAAAILVSVSLRAGSAAL
jgi:hypothetical protein